MKKKLLVVHPSSELYGADRILLLVLDFLQKNYNITVILKQDGPLVEYLKNEIDMVDIIIEKRMPIIRRDLMSLKGITKWIKDNIYFYKIIKIQQFDMLYINTLACFSISLLSKIQGQKNIIHVHEIISKPKIVNLVTSNIAMFSADKIIAVSEAVKSNMHMLFSKNKIVVVHNGINDLSNTNIVKKDKEKITFTLIGRIMPEKGQWFLLDALSLIKDNIKDKASFLLVGGPPPYRQELFLELEAEIRNRGLTNLVTLIGFVENPQHILAETDVSLVPSMMADPFPTTVIEAMSFSKPVITTNHGGAKEIIKDGENGYLIEKGDSVALSNKILSMIENVDSISKMGNNARKYYLENLTIDNFKNRFLKEFLNV